MWHVTVVSPVESVPDIHLGKYHSFEAASIATKFTFNGIQKMQSISKVIIEYIPESDNDE